jgi:hypothetical protein
MSGTTAALFCYVGRDLARPQWSDVGMSLHTVMLLLHTEGLHSCPQMAWAKFHDRRGNCHASHVGRRLAGKVATQRDLAVYSARDRLRSTQ